MKCSLLILGLIAAYFCYGCHGVCTYDEQVIVDSLNDISFSQRYSTLSSCETNARLARDLSNGYNDGLCESNLNLAFAKYMLMDYDSAMSICIDIAENTKNKLIRLMADVELMRICGQTSQNKLFYEYRNDALICMNRVKEEMYNMTERQLRYWGYAVSEYHLVSAEYFCDLGQERTAIGEIDALEDLYPNLYVDSVQYAKLLVLKCVNDIFPDDSSVKFRNVVRAYRMSFNLGARYLCAKTMQILSDDLVETDSLEDYRIENIKRLLDVEYVSNDSLPILLSNRSLEYAILYGNRCLESYSYLSISNCHFHEGEYDEALTYAEKALEVINENNVMRYADITRLLPYSEYNDSVFVEMNWINDADILINPYWLADVREKLSIIYSALGMKGESDYNRNIYLDILDATRQDMRMQQRVDDLESERHSLDWTLYVVGTVMLLMLLLMFFIVRWQKSKNVIRLREKLSIIQRCKTLLSSSFVDKNISDEIDVVENSFADVRRDSELMSVIEVFRDWIDNHKCLNDELSNMQQDIESENYLLEKRIIDNKRDNIGKLTCLSIINGIAPFLDRAINEVTKIKDSLPEVGECACDIRKRRLEYLSELVNKINEYNEVFARCVMMRKGMIGLHIENFALQPLFEIFNENKSLFDACGVKLFVEPTSAVVKADSALTFFMINTLLDNARKYTESGGCVYLIAEERDDGSVVISVKDTGTGMSEDDVNMILNNKTYDYTQIGKSSDEKIRRNKGYGFGLMSCKGIIDKYLKTASIFSVCRFGIKSKLGEGSTFSFTLPKGVLRNAITILYIVLLPLISVSCSDSVEGKSLDSDVIMDDSLLSMASSYADKVYFSNIQEGYDSALVYADSSLMMLNEYHAKMGYDVSKMSIDGPHPIPEIAMLEKDIVTDYHIILDVRNEVAIAALALNLWDVYCYNNEVYTHLYMLMSQDENLEAYCESIARANISKQTAIIVIFVLVIAFVFIILLFYYKNNWLPMFNMRQLIWMNRRMYSETPLVSQNMEKMEVCMIEKGTPDFAVYYNRFLRILFECVSDIKNTSGIALSMVATNGEGRTLFSSDLQDKEYISELMSLAQKKNEVVVSANRKIRVYPLMVENIEVSVGVLAMIFNSNTYTEYDDAIFRLITQFAALNLYYSNIRVETKLLDIESLKDKKMKIQYEENMSHVQNQILENCLSTIKHETMYYPNRVRQIVDGILHHGAEHDCSADINCIDELLVYYKKVFSILYRHASRQLDNTMFKRKKMKIEELVEYVWDVYAKLQQKNNVDLKLCIKSESDMLVLCDEQLLKYLFHVLMTMSFEDERCGCITLSFDKSDGFVNFAFTDDRGHYEAEKLNSMFYPDALSTADDAEARKVMQILVCKQIIREHDDHIGQRGCRMYACPNEPYGYQLVFKLPI